MKTESIAAAAAAVGTRLPDLNDIADVVIQMEQPETLTVPQLLSFLKSSFEKSDFDAIESVLAARDRSFFEALAVKEVEGAELRSKCRRLEEQLGRKQRETEELRARVLELENEKGVIEISDSEEEDRDDAKSVTGGVGELPELKKGMVLVEGLGKDEDFLMTPTLKRKRAARIVEDSDGEDDGGNVVEEDDDDDNDDDVSIRELLKRSRGGGNTQKEDDDKIPSRRRLVKLGQCEAKKEVRRGSSSEDSESDSPMYSRGSGRRLRKERPTACQRLVFSDTGDNEGRGGIELDSEDESLSGFIVDDEESDGQRSGHGSSASSGEEHEEEDSCDTLAEDSGSDVCLGDVLSSIRRKKNCKEWEYEGDMLASFAEDPMLCMKAVCALYRQQTSEEQSAKETIIVNGRGFSQPDAHRASMIAEYLLDGYLYGPPKKSVEEFKKQHPTGLAYCRKIAEKYSKQLFTMYIEGEDPFFGPS